ncbi:hypothetical protein [Telmatospirillum sp.]|uniref:hypothetical protein n=1 Tax=Telmatospirillum sp. TaxID=2079197 RepID=UPI0028403944|nr:hypothetical protein [Telmatospirillum sp.]MDR3436391.1 hypothetical protein [Telmatospirillum sp.]
MKVQTNLAVIDTMDLPGETTIAGINANNTMAYWHMVDTLYPDKPKAIVQELSSNCYDEMRKYGVARPPEIFGPTVLDPNISFRDFAKGMDHDFVMSKYMELFTSTKTGDDEQRGGFGLGCKTPFSYTDQFSVESFQGGTVRSYLVFRGPHPQTGQEVPMVTHLGTEPTDEPDGLKVTIPVEGKDFALFSTAIRDICWRYDPQPRTNTKLRTPEILLTGRNFKLRRQDQYAIEDTKACAVFGDIAYPINRIPLGVTYGDTLYGLLSSPVDIAFGIDEVAPVLSRTAIDYKPRVVANIKARCAEVIADMTSALEDKIAAQPSLWEAVKFWHNDISDEVRGILKDSPPRWRGTDLGRYLIVRHSSGLITYRLNSHDCEKARTPLKPDIYDDPVVTPDKTTILWWPKDAPLTSASVGRRLRLWGLKSKTDVVILKCDRSTLDDILVNQLGGAPLDATIDDATMPEPPKARRPPAARKKRQKFHTYRGAGEFVAAEVDLNEGGLYVVTRNKEAIRPDDGYSYPSLDTLVGLAPTKVICVPATFQNTLAKLPNWHNAYVVMRKAALVAQKDRTLPLSEAASSVLSVTSSELDELMAVITADDVKPRSLLGRYITEQKRLRTLSQCEGTNQLRRLIHAFDLAIGAPANFHSNLLDLGQQVIARYPLINLFDDDQDRAPWIQYLNAL